MCLSSGEQSRLATDDEDDDLTVNRGNGYGGGDGRISVTPAESVKTIRSHSHDPTQILRRPSRIEHLSEIFRFVVVLIACNRMLEI